MLKTLTIILFAFIFVLEPTLVRADTTQPPCAELYEDICSPPDPPAQIPQINILTIAQYDALYGYTTPIVPGAATTTTTATTTSAETTDL